MFVRNLDASEEGVWWKLEPEAREAIMDWLRDHEVDAENVRGIKLTYEGAIEVEEFVLDKNGNRQLRPGTNDEIWTQPRQVLVDYIPKAWPVSRDYR